MPTIASVAVQLYPSFKGGVRLLSTQLSGPATQAGRTAGLAAGKVMGESVQQGAQRGLAAVARDLKSATAAVGRARDAQAAAAGKVRVAEAQLQEVRGRANAKASQLAAAEERVNTARRGQSASVRGVTSAVAAETVAQGNLERAENAANKERQFGAKVNQRFKDSLKGLAAPVAGFFAVATIKKAIGVAADFQQEISSIGAVSGATGAELDSLRAKALQIGKDTSFGATEAASAIEELAKAGISTADILGGAADATTALAAAGGVALPEAATISANALNAFGLQAKQLPKIADTIAGAANASAIDIDQFGYSLSQAGASAHTVGLSFGDLATATAELGNAGIVGSDAGTSIKTFLAQLQPQTKQAAAEMKNLGLVTEDGTSAFFDQAGKIKSLRDIQGALQQSLSGLTQQQKAQALQTLFGADASRAAGILAEQGAAGYDKLSAAIGKVSAQDVAAKRLDNFRGSVEQLKGSVETIAINVGTKALPVLKRFTDFLTNDGLPGVTGFFGFLARQKDVLLPLAAGAAAFYGALKLGQGVASVAGRLVDAFAAAQVRAAAATGAFGKAQAALNLSLKANPIGLIATAIGGAVAALSIWRQHTQDQKQAQEDLTAAIKADSGVVGDNTKAHVVDALQKAGTLEQYRKLGINLGVVTDAYLGNADAQRSVNSQLDAYQSAITNQAVANGQYGTTVSSITKQTYDQAAAAKSLQSQLGEQNSELARSVQSGKDYSQAMGGSAAATETFDVKAAAAAASAKTLKTDQDALAKANDAVTKGLKDLNDDVQTLIGGYFSVSSSSDAVQSALNGIASAAKNSKTGLRGTSDEAIAFRGAVQDAVGKIGDFITAEAQQGVSSQKILADFKSRKQALIDELKQTGATKAQIKLYTDALNGIPEVVKTDVTLPGVDQSRAKSKLLNDTLGKQPPAKYTNIYLPGATKAQGQTNLLNRTLHSQPAATSTKIYLPGATQSQLLARRVGDAVAAIPTKAHTDISLSTNAQKVYNDILKLAPSTVYDGQAKKNQKGLDGYATGGLIQGPGTGTSDSILARLSHGEYVINAKATARHRALIEAINHDRLPGFRRGGLIGDTKVSASTVPAGLIHPGSLYEQLVGGFAPAVVGAVVKSAQIGVQAALASVSASSPGGDAVYGKWGAPGTNIVTARADGHSFQVNRIAVTAFQNLVNDLAQNYGYHARSIGGFNNRNIAGSSRKSNHAYGAAIDIDPNLNPVTQHGPLPFALPKNSKQIADRHSMRWGGEYGPSNGTGYKDYMHFEIDGSPANPGRAESSGAPQSAAKGAPAGNRRLGMQIANSLGLGGGFSSIDYIFQHESSWNQNAKNPSSSARGIPQFLAATWRAYGGYSSDPGYQIRKGIQYMLDRYGSLGGAESFWRKHHYYDTGGQLNHGTTAINASGRPEYVLNPADTQAFFRGVEQAKSGDGVDGRQVVLHMHGDAAGLFKLIDARVDDGLGNVGQLIRYGAG